MSNLMSYLMKTFCLVCQAQVKQVDLHTGARCKREAQLKEKEQMFRTIILFRTNITLYERSQSVECIGL